VTGAVWTDLPYVLPDAQHMAQRRQTFFLSNIWCVYTRGIALVSDCSRNSDVRCSTQSFAPKHKIQEVATTHIFLRNDGNNLLTHKLEET